MGEHIDGDLNGKYCILCCKGFLKGFKNTFNLLVTGASEMYKSIPKKLSLLEYAKNDLT